MLVVCTVVAATYAVESRCDVIGKADVVQHKKDIAERSYYLLGEIFY